MTRLIAPAANRIRPGNLAEYFHHWLDACLPGDAVILTCRVSGRLQDHRGNNQDQATRLRIECAKRRIEVAGVVMHVGPGWHPEWLARAVELAKRSGVTKLLARSTNRYLRHESYSKAAWQLQPTDHELRLLKAITGDLTLCTFLDPCATAADERKLESEWGLWANASTLRPSVRKRLLINDARELRDVGWPLRRIARELNVPPMTISDWLRSTGKHLYGSDSAKRATRNTFEDRVLPAQEIF